MSGLKGASSKGRFNKDVQPMTPTERVAQAKERVIAAARMVEPEDGIASHAGQRRLHVYALRSRLRELDELVSKLQRAHPDWRVG